MAYDYFVGVDEVGRGPLAGPVAVGVFVVAKSQKSKVQRLLRGIRDSKQLSERKREEWFVRLSRAREVGVIDFRVSFVGPKQIDTIGIVRATQIALNRSLAKTGVDPKKSQIRLDGGLSAPKKFLHQETIVGGDRSQPVVAAASIVAKVLRDRRMVRHAQEFPKYGFERHKGYGTQQHLRALRRHSISPLHRRSFLPSFA